jgi:hypothetical protein
MGQAPVSTSKATTEIIRDVASNVIVNSSQECRSKNAAVQRFSLKNINTKGCKVNISNINQDMQVSTNFKCIQDSNVNSSSVNQFKTNLEQELTSQASGLINLNAAETETINTMHDKILNNINLSQLASCISQNIARQEKSIGGINMDCTGMPAGSNELNISNLQQIMISSNVVDCLQDQKTVADAANTIDQIIKTKQTSTSETFGNFGNWWILILVICICISSSSVGVAYYQQ